MGIIFNDTFTDPDETLLESHTPNTGTGWTALWKSDPNNAFEVNSNQCDPAGGLGEGMIYTADATYDSADYTLQADIINIDANDDPIYLFVRIQDVDNMYGVYLLNNGGNDCRLYKKVAGAWTALGTAFTAPANGSVVELEIVGSSLKFYDDGIEVASATDSDITGTGKAGIGAGGSTELVNSGDDANASGPIYDNLTVTTTGGGDPEPEVNALAFGANF